MPLEIAEEKDITDEIDIFLTPNHYNAKLCGNDTGKNHLEKHFFIAHYVLTIRNLHVYK